MAESADVATGETPAVAQPPAPPSTIPPVSAAAPDSEEDEAYDKDRAMATIRKLRAEAKQAVAAIRERDTLKTAQQAAVDAQLSEQERLTKRTQQLEADIAHERQQRQDQINHYEVQLAASRLGLVDPDAVVKLLDWTTLEYDDSGKPRDIDRALKTLVKERPYLAGQVAAPPMAATNGASRTGAPGQRIYKQAELNDYQFYSAHRDDILLAMRQNRIEA